MSKQPEALRLQSAMIQAAIVISSLPPNPGFNGSILLIDDAEADQIADDCEAAADAISRLHALNAELVEALQAIDGDLSRVLYELAGSASMCWEPRPSGVFESTEAIGFVETAINEIRTPIRAALNKATEAA